MKAYFKNMVLLFQLLLVVIICAEGFVAGTLVKTSTGYSAIENIRVNDHVLCCDSSNNMVEKPVLFLEKKCVLSHARVYVDGVCLVVGLDQKFYCACQKKWVSVLELHENDVVGVSDNALCIVRRIEFIDEPVELYCLCVQDIHNFCVSELDIVVHNFFPVVAAVVWAFGLGGVELASVGLGLAGGTFIGYSAYKKQQRTQQSYNITVGSFGGNGMSPEDPDDDDEEDLEEKKRQRDQARKEHQPPQNKDARESAKDLGYREIKDHPLGNTRGKPVFTNGRDFISPDADGHSGAFWKVFDSKGVIKYAMDKRLRKICRTYKRKR